MTKQPFFTIGIPVYNVEKYLAASLESVLTQSFTDFEVIAVDDGSPDNCGKILDEYAAKDNRIKVVHRKNCGVSAARNAVISNAIGQYIFFLDSDDYMYEGALEKSHKAIIEQNYPDFLQIGFRKIMKDTVVEFLDGYPGDKYYAEGITADDRLLMLFSDKILRDQVYTRFMSREFLQTHGFAFNTSLTAQEDSDFTFNLYRKADNIGYGEFFVYQYNKERADSVTGQWSCRAIAGVFCRWHSFFYSDWQFYNLSPVGLEIFKKEKREFLEKIRYGIIALPLYRSDEEIEILLELLESFFEKDVRKLPIGSSRHAPLYLMYKLFGIRTTVAVLKPIAKILKIRK